MTHEAGWAHAQGALRGPSWLREPRDVNALVLYMIVIGVISLLIDLVMRRLQRSLTPWRQA